MEDSKIEWTQNTFNPWVGCHKVSPGCKFCYAERDMTRKPLWENTWGPAATSTRIRTSDKNWDKPFQWNRKAKAEGKRVRVFCASLADVFEDNPLLDGWRMDLLAIMKHTPYLDWQVLTKRPENIMRMVLEGWEKEWPENVWIGTSVEDQQRADERIPHLLKVPAKIRFISAEPLLGEVDLMEYMGATIYNDDAGRPAAHKLDINWVIVGGESGNRARITNPNWVRSLRDQCLEAGVAFHFKQWGEYEYQRASPELSADELGLDGYSAVRVGKKVSGRLLDGREWNGMPGE